VKHAKNVVDCRVVGTFFVTVVEPIQLGKDDPARERYEKEKERGLRVQATERALGHLTPGKRELGDKKSEREGEEIGSEKKAPD
jgi:hypothetical protein